MALVGVIMRTKNRPLLLKRAIQSVCNQTMTDWELAIVNDGGEPGPVNELVDALPEDIQKKIHRIHNPESVGMEAASNLGLNALSSKYAIVHDDDDSLDPEFFEKTSSFLENPPHASVKGVITHTLRIIEAIEGNIVRQIRTYPYNDWLQTISIRRMLAENVYAPIAFLFDRKACIEAGAFREDLPVLGDWDFNVRFLLKYEIGVIQEQLAYYHDRESSGDAEYLSSVKAKAHLHEFYDNLLRNEWLRSDIESGRTGTGLIANKAVMLWDLAWEVKEEVKKKKRFKLFK
ncbi:MAG: glycosyltransferase family 2 protein [Puniceicoccaceae bacterium]